MRIYPFPGSRKKIITILFIVGVTSFLFAQEPNLDSARDSATAKKESSWEERNLSELQRQARQYRRQGVELQRIGNLDTALSLYQKAIELDPVYAIAYNDLGIMYEAKGLLEQAEENYLKSIKIDPRYLSAYSNLALLYENKRNLDKATLYWEKRAELGSPDDPWTERAKQRLEDIGLVREGRTSGLKEREVIGLMKEIVNQKDILKQDNKALGNKYFQKAKQSYEKEDYATAIKEALDAQQLEPANKEIEKFIEKVQIRALSR